MTSSLLYMYSHCLLNWSNNDSTCDGWGHFSQSSSHFTTRIGNFLRGYWLLFKHALTDSHSFWAVIEMGFMFSMCCMGAGMWLKSKLIFCLWKGCAYEGGTLNRMNMVIKPRQYCIFNKKLTFMAIITLNLAKRNVYIYLKAFHAQGCW